jgi:demethylmenaquinone methyltransferase/2-methoxy-6-polyprenyl-1,4-benzoquinol methylase
LSLPSRVAAALVNASELGFEMSCDPGVGALLGVLAAAVPPNGRILELGTGSGVGLGWIVEGINGRSDVEVVSVELDPTISAAAARVTWPSAVRLEVGDALEFIAEPRQWDLIFADAQGGKWEGLEETIQSLRPGGVLLVDDMTPAVFVSEEHRSKTAEVRRHLLSSHDLAAVEIGWSTGLILCTRRHSFDGAITPV